MVTLSTVDAERIQEPPRQRGRRETTGYRTFRIVNTVLLAGVVILTLFPLVNILARSFSGEHQIRTGQVTFWPKGFNLTTYRRVITDPAFLHGYWNTLVYTFLATLVAMVLTTCYAYVLSKKSLRGRKVLTGIALFTLFFSGGIIPNYVLISKLGMLNTVFAIIVPNAINVFNLLVMKSFFENLPEELDEAAQVDGLNTYQILWHIVLPLSKAVLATMVLFYAVSFWNSWFSAFLYLSDPDMWPVTIYLRNLIAGATGGTDVTSTSEAAQQISANIQAVTIVLTVLPIMTVYPFIQRYFVSGVMLGAVKG
jgi:putative aldouronate transport system permease protein